MAARTYYLHLLKSTFRARGDGAGLGALRSRVAEFWRENDIWRENYALFFFKKTGFGNGSALETYVFESLRDMLQTVLISSADPFPNPFNRRFYGTPLGHS